MRENLKTPALALLLSSVMMSSAFAMAPEDRDDRDGSPPAKAGPGTLTLNGNLTANNDGTLTLPNGVTVTLLPGATLTFAGGTTFRNQPPAPASR